MNVSVKAEYALLAIFDLAASGGKDPVKIAEIARRQKIPQKFLELILGTLKQGGFVESRRGAEGGYLLARRPDSIHVGEVLRCVEGQHEDRARRRKDGNSPLLDLWERADNAIDSVLDSTTFAQLVREYNEKHTKFVPNWEI